MRTLAEILAALERGETISAAESAVVRSSVTAPTPAPAVVLPPEAQAQLDAMAVRLARAEETTAIAEDIRLTAHFEQAALSLHLPTAMGAVLREASSTMSAENYAALTSTLSAQNAQINSSALFGTVGRAGQAVGSVDAHTELNARIKAMVQSSPGTSLLKAQETILAADVDLARKIRTELVEGRE